MNVHEKIFTLGSDFLVVKFISLLHSLIFLWASTTISWAECGLTNGHGCGLPRFSAMMSVLPLPISNGERPGFRSRHWPCFPLFLAGLLGSSKSRLWAPSTSLTLAPPPPTSRPVALISILGPRWSETNVFHQSGWVGLV